jgi:uncharacterized protein HemY
MTTALLLTAATVVLSVVIVLHLERRLHTVCRLPTDTEPSRQPTRGDFFLWELEMNRKDRDDRSHA